MARGQSKRGAEVELEWYFLCASHVMGYQGASLEPGGGAHWDQAALDRLHDARVTTRHRAGLREAERVRHALARVPREAMATLVATFTPRPWDAALRSAAGRAGEASTLAGLIVTSDEARALYAEARKRTPRDAHDVARFLADVARTGMRSAVFRRLERPARERLERAVSAYLEARIARERERREGEREAWRAELGS